MNDGPTIHDLVAPPEMDGWRLDRALTTLMQSHSRERIKALISSGHLTENEEVRRDPARKVQCGAKFTLTVPPPTPAHNAPQDIPLTIVFEDEHLLLVDKPSGLVVHPAAGNFEGTLVNALLHHCAGRLSGIGGVARPGIVHRIDKDTSGLLVVAKNDQAHEGLAVQFARHSIDRRYVAIIGGSPLKANGTVEAPLARSPQNRKKIAILAHGKHAITHWSVQKRFTHATLIECRLETGRTHQIRVHMASLGHPLLGDPVYGRTPASLKELLRSNNFQRQALHAAYLGFEHPITGQYLNFQSALPSDMQRLLSELRL